MQLSRIKIDGFKTFAESTTIEVRPGITVIVGPNGSGKSNIIDAIRWVMGEQSMLSLRASTTDELIFNGATLHKPQQMAEVSLVFDNSDGLIPLNGAEISITKRLYRSREQEYLLNNNPVRLKEIRSLFDGTGIGYAPYSVLEQGKADALLSRKMDERRAIFEEVAGIRGYRLRYAEAERDLNNAVEKIRRLEPLLQEIQHQHTKLKQQAQEVEKYRLLNEKLRRATMQRVLKQYQSRYQLQQTLSDKLQRARHRQSELHNQSNALLVKQQQREEQEQQLRAGLLQIHEQLHANELRQERENHELQRIAQQAQNIEQRVEQESQLLAHDQRRIASLRQEQESEQQAESKSLQRATELSHQLETLQKTIAQHHSYIREQRHIITTLRNKQKNSEQKREQLWERIRELSEQIVNALEQLLHPQGSGGRSWHNRLSAEIAQSLRQISSRLEQQSQQLGQQVLMELTGREAVQRLIKEHQRVMGVLQQDHDTLAEKIESYRAVVDPLMHILTDPQGSFARRHALDREYRQLREQIEMTQSEVQLAEKAIATTSDSVGQLHTQETQLQIQSERYRHQAVLHQKHYQRLRNEIEELTQSRDQVHDRISASRQEKERLKEKETQAQDARTYLSRQQREGKRSLTTTQHMISKLEKAITEIKERIRNREQALNQHNRRVEQIAERYNRVAAQIEEMKAQFLVQYGEEIEQYERGHTDGERATSTKEIEQLKRDISLLGKVNMMAPVEFEEIDARYQLLNEQLEDLRRARIDLRQVTDHIIAQSSTNLLSTIEGTARHFNNTFRDLFGGGSAKIQVVNPSEPLNSPIHIEARPPGKHPRHIEQLSGGERSLSALSLLFALFRQNPSPIALMDEVDATLDENNVANFGSYIQQYGEHTQFIIISHSQHTIACAETLIGVTMQDEGVSKVVELDTREYIPRTL